MKTCRGKEQPADAWGDSDTIHAIKHGKCLQLKGAIVKNATFDKNVAAKLATRNAVLKEGGCGLKFDKKELFHRTTHGITISIWE